MNSDLLQDLAQYKRARDKPVATAARALISLFRELAPKMLEKKDRGRGADLDRDVDAYGSEKVLDRIEGAELLQREESRLRKEERAAEKAAAAAAAALESDDEAESGGGGRLGRRGSRRLERRRRRRRGRGSGRGGGR